MRRRFRRATSALLEPAMAAGALHRLPLCLSPQPACLRGSDYRLRLGEDIRNRDQAATTQSTALDVVRPEDAVAASPAEAESPRFLLRTFPSGPGTRYWLRYRRGGARTVHSLWHRDLAGTVRAGKGGDGGAGWRSRS